MIIIGEKMEERVLPATKDVFKRIFKNAETFDADPLNSAAFDQMVNQAKQQGRRLTESEIKNSALYLENLNWIRNKLASGYNVIDIGPKIPNQVKSTFYAMERSHIYTK